MKYDASTLADLAARLRGRRRDPDVITLSSAETQAMGDRALRLTRTMAKAQGLRPVDTATSDEAAEIDRITRELGIQ